MTEQEQRIAIAEACGWGFLKSGLSLTIGKDGVGTCTGRFDQFDGIAQMAKLPDYLRDLNAMNEAEVWLETHHPQWCMDYVIEFQRVLNSKTVGAFRLMNATAAQRAEAFLRTIGKWKDTP